MHQQITGGDNNLINDLNALIQALMEPNKRLYLFKQHEILYNKDIGIQQLRSSPNFEGGITTFATCKHLMRTYPADWEESWLAGLCPSATNNSALLFVGRIGKVFTTNKALSSYIRNHHPDAYLVKQADTNPRGDLYTPKSGSDIGDHHTQYVEPPENHTRREMYKKSPGSISERPDGKIPKWWRDVEYKNVHGKRPPVFVFSKCYIFKDPMAWSNINPGRASMKLSSRQFAKSLMDRDSKLLV